MKRLFALLCGMVWLAISASAAAYSSLYIFGDSLSDVGNNAIAFGGAFTPQSAITSNSFIPSGAPYESGHYTNGDIWAQSFAAALHLPDPTPTLLSAATGTDFAFGGARTGPIDPGFPNITTIPPTLATQAAIFIGAKNGVVPSTALYVVAGGGNDARDAANAIFNGADPTATIASAASDYATNISGIVHDLENAGAEHIVVWNVPDLGQTPYVRSIPGASGPASFLASQMNIALLAAVGQDPDVTVFDLFDTVDAVIDDPAKYGLANVTDACGAVVGCDPSQYLFWDGIHPTSAGHELIAGAMFGLVVPEPTLFALLLPGLLIVALMGRRRRA